MSPFPWPALGRPLRDPDRTHRGAAANEAAPSRVSVAFDSRHRPKTAAERACGDPLRDIHPVRLYLPVGRNLFMGDPGSGCLVPVPLWLMWGW